MPDTDRLPRWPHYRLTQTDDAFTVHGPGSGNATHSSRASAIDQLTSIAARIGRPVPATATDADATQWPLLVHPDGTVSSTGPAIPARRKKTSPKKPKPRAPKALSAARAPVAALPPAAPTADVSPAHQAISDLAAQGRHREAADIAAQLDDALTQQHGPSDRSALNARETRATLLSAAGDLTTAVALFRDIAERYALQGDLVAATSLADRAQELWQQMPHAHATDVGPTIIRMRSQIPGPAGIGYQNALAHLAYLDRSAAAPLPEATTADQLAHQGQPMPRS